MPTVVRSFAKINVGLLIGERRNDDFHELRTVYHTIDLHDIVRVEQRSGTGIEIRCKDPSVPTDETNTCWRIADRVCRHLKKRCKLLITIEKILPVQGGLGAASSNAVATMLGLEKELNAEIAMDDRLRLAAEVGSDLPLFLLGGAVFGLGRGEQVVPLPELPTTHCVVLMPQVAVSTPQAFARWDQLAEREKKEACGHPGGLTVPNLSDKMDTFSRCVDSWLSGILTQQPQKARAASGVSGVTGDRAEALLLDLVRAGIENDFERVVFPEHPELREVKRVLERQGAQYCSLSGSGSALYGLFATQQQAAQAAAALAADGLNAHLTCTLNRADYWKQIWK